MRDIYNLPSMCLHSLDRQNLTFTFQETPTYLKWLHSLSIHTKLLCNFTYVTHLLRNFLLAVFYLINNCPTRCNTKQSITLQVHSTCFGCQTHPSSGVHKPVTTSSVTGHIFCVQVRPSNVAKLAMFEGGSCSTGGCSYSFVYSWWWVWLTPETCGVNLQNNK